MTFHANTLKSLYAFMAKHPNLLLICTFLFIYNVAWICKRQISASITQSAQPPRKFFRQENSVVHDYYDGNIQRALREHAQEDIALFFLYAPWDVECRRSRSTIEQVAQQLNGQIPVIAVNCWHGAEACRQHGYHLFRFPHLLARVRRPVPLEPANTWIRRAISGEEHFQIRYKGPLYASHSSKVRNRSKRQYVNVPHSANPSPSARKLLASDHVMAFVHRLLFPYHAINSVIHEDDEHEHEAIENSTQISRLSTDHDNVLVAFFDPTLMRKSHKFLHFYESSLLSMDKRWYSSGGAPFHLAFALITSQNHSYISEALSPAFPPVDGHLFLSLYSSTSSSSHGLLQFSGNFPHGTLLLLRAGNTSVVLQDYRSSADILKFLEAHTQQPLVHHLFLKGVKSQELHNTILATGPALLLLTAEDPRCRLKPMQKWLRRLSMVQRFQRSDRVVRLSEDVTDPQTISESFLKWRLASNKTRQHHRESNSRWARYCRHWYSWLQPAGGGNAQKESSGSSHSSEASSLLFFSSTSSPSSSSSSQGTCNNLSFLLRGGVGGMDLGSGPLRTSGRACPIKGRHKVSETDDDSDVCRVGQTISEEDDVEILRQATMMRQPARHIFTQDTPFEKNAWEESVELWGRAQLSVSCDNPSHGTVLQYADSAAQEAEEEHELEELIPVSGNRSMHFGIVDGPGSDVLRARLGMSALGDVVALIVDLQQENIFVLEKAVNYLALRGFVQDFLERLAGRASRSGSSSLRSRPAWHMVFPHEASTSSDKWSQTTASLPTSALCSGWGEVPPLITGLQLDAWIDAAATVAWREKCTAERHDKSCCHLLVYYDSSHCGFCAVLWPKVLTAWRYVNDVLLHHHHHRNTTSHSEAPFKKWATVSEPRFEDVVESGDRPEEEHTHWSSVDVVSLVRLDLTANVLPWRLRVERVPALILFPAASASQSVAFPLSHSLTVPNMVEFILSHIAVAAS